MTKWENMKNIAQEDLGTLKRAEEAYGDSWKRLLDDIRDLRRYLILVENELVYGKDGPRDLIVDNEEKEEGE